MLPFVNGVPRFEAFQVSDLGGAQIVSSLDNLLAEKGYSFTTKAEMVILKDMMQKKASVAFDLDEEVEALEEDRYELPDG